MNNIINKPILIGTLAIVFSISLFYSYGPGYASDLVGYLGISTEKSGDSKMSPSDMVTDVVTVKKEVTDNTVTSDTLVSPHLSPTPFTVTTSPKLSHNEANKALEVTISPTPSSTPLVTPIPTNSTSPVYSPTTPVTMGSVVINEIGWMGTGSTTKLSNDEWIELYNTTDKAINLEHWTLKSLTGAYDPKIMLSGTIGPKGYYLLERTDDAVISDMPANQIYTGSLSDSGESLELGDSSGLVVDLVSSEGSWYAGSKEGRLSMERINTSKSGDNSNNWGTNNGSIKNGRNTEGGLINGTPGKANSIASF